MLSEESSNFNEKEDKEEPDTIRCDNCHQDIERKKMFLHEGFCHRNNVFCEHCEQVFLKEDYEQHIIDLPKNLTSKKDDTSTNSKKSTSNEEEASMPVISQSITTINPNTSLEFVHLPLVEEYTINTPIVISECGQIVSNKNKNEFLLPFLGINPIHSYTNQYIMNSNANIQNNNYQRYNNYTFGGQSHIYQNSIGNTFNCYENNLQTNYQSYDEIFSNNIIEPSYNNNAYEEKYQLNNNIVINNNAIEYEKIINFNEINNYLPSEISSEEIISPNNDFSQEEKKKKHKLKVEVIRTPKKKEPMDNIEKSTALKNGLKTSQKTVYSHKTYKLSDKNCITEKKKKITKKRKKKLSLKLVENKDFQLKINKTKKIKYNSSKTEGPINRKILTHSLALETEIEPQIREFEYENEKRSIYTENKSIYDTFTLRKKYITPIVTKINKKKIDKQNVKYGSEMNVSKNLFPQEFPIEKNVNELIYTEKRNYPGKKYIKRNRNVYAQSAERNRVRTLYDNLNFTPQEKYRTGLSEAIYYSAYKNDKDSIYNGMDDNYEFKYTY